MTHDQQRKQLFMLIRIYLDTQRTATTTLRAINQIGLCENEGNPLNSAIQGEDALRAYATIEGVNPFIPGEFQTAIDEAKKSLDANGYIV